MKERLTYTKDRILSKVNHSSIESFDFGRTPIPFSQKGTPGSKEDARTFGASSELYDFWRPHLCGVCCLKMIGDAVGATKDLSLYTLTERCVSKGVLKVDKHNEVFGAYHYPMATMLHEMGVPAQVEGQLTGDVIEKSLSSGKLVMLSVDLAKVEHCPSDESHLVLVYESLGGALNSFRLHDCASALGPDGNGMTMESAELMRISNEKGLIVG